MVGSKNAVTTWPNVASDDVIGSRRRHPDPLCGFSPVAAAADKKGGENVGPGIGGASCEMVLMEPINRLRDITILVEQAIKSRVPYGLTPRRFVHLGF